MLRHAGVALALVLTATGCDGLGNPPLEARFVGPSVESESGVVLITRVTVVPASRAAAVLREGRPDVLDPSVREAPFVALVQVASTNVPYVRGVLVTKLELVDGTLATFRWPSSTRRVGGTGVFGLSKPARSATTHLE